MNTLCKNPNKKAKKAKNQIGRVMVKFNTGTRTHKSKKDYDRKKFKKLIFAIDKIKNLRYNNYRS